MFIKYFICHGVSHTYNNIKNKNELKYKNDKEKKKQNNKINFGNQ